MKTIGFVISEKENENRKAILPHDIKHIRYKANLYLENGYGKSLGISDEDYIEMGVKMVSRKKVLQQDIICDPKVGEAEYLNDLSSNQSIFGWVHAGNNKQLVDLLLNKKLEVLAWEKMYKSSRHVFWRNNEIAGEAAILHAFTLFTKLPHTCNVALIGKGNVSMGAHKMLSALGAKVKIFDRKTLSGLRDELLNFDLVVNAVLWDKTRNDHIIYKSDLKLFKKPAMIVDISCDEAGAIETSKPTTFNDPTYLVDNVIHYAVDHTPTIFSHSASEAISYEISKYLDLLIEDNILKNEVLSNSLIISDGRVIDEKIKATIK